MCASLCCRGKPQERVALWRETFESSLGSSKLSPFLKWYDLKDTTTRRASVCVGLCCRGKEGRGKGAVCYG